MSILLRIAAYVLFFVTSIALLVIPTADVTLFQVAVVVTPLVVDSLIGVRESYKYSEDNGWNIGDLPIVSLVDMFLVFLFVVCVHLHNNFFN